MAFNYEQIKYWDAEVRRSELKLKCIDHQLLNIPVNSDAWDVLFKQREIVLEALTDAQKHIRNIRSSVL